MAVRSDVAALVDFRQQRRQHGDTLGQAARYAPFFRQKSRHDLMSPLRECPRPASPSPSDGTRRPALAASSTAFWLADRRQDFFRFFSYLLTEICVPRAQTYPVRWPVVHRETRHVDRSGGRPSGRHRPIRGNHPSRANLVPCPGDRSRRSLSVANIGVAVGRERNQPVRARFAY
jgi:hypothetical protein